MLRDLLQKNHGLELPIAGGSGRTAQDPIVMITDSVYLCIEAQDSIASALFGSQQWRLIGKQRDTARPCIECCEYELRFLDGQRLVAEPRQLYFDLRSLQPLPSHPTPACGVSLAPWFSFDVPAQFGWLHFQDSQALAAPARGLQLRYLARETQVQLQIFADGAPPSETHLEEAMRRTLQQLQSQHPSLQVVTENQSINLRYASFDIGQRFSALALTHFQGTICKIHMQLTEQAIGQDFQCLMDALSVMISYFNPKSTTH